VIKKLVPTIFTWVGIIVTLALAPTIETYNSAVTTNISASSNAAYMIGMTAIDDYGGLIMIMALLLGTGLFAFSSSKAGKTTGVGGILRIVGEVVGAVVILALFSGSAIGYFNSLITAATGVAKTIYGVLVTATYVAIIAGVGTYQVYRSVKGRRKSRKARFA